MAILSRPRFLPQQRLDLEDVNALLSALRTDSKLYTKQFLSGQNLIYKGFVVSGIGLKSATVAMPDSTLIIPQSNFDFSWFTAAPGEANIVIPDADLTDGTRNYVEIELATENNTPLTKAFWDPEANSGLGSEFNQIVETITDLKVNFVVSTGGFSGLPDRLPLAILDVDGSGNIKTILDRRILFGRLAIPANINNDFSWGTKLEPAYALTLNGVSGTFEAGETITIGGETAKVTTGGTSAIAFNVPSGINFFPGDTVTGGTSGATGTVNTVSESFTGVDKNLKCQKDINDALMTELKVVKGTRFWWENPASSIVGIVKFLESILVQNTATAAFAWDGSELSITDDNGTPADGDILGYIRIMGRGDDLALTREDGTTSPIAIADGEVLYVKVPATGSRSFSGVGSSDTNFQLVDIASYVSSDESYWLAYREGSRLYIRGYGELEPGEEVNIGDPELEDILASIAANLASANQDRTLKLVEGGTWSLNLDGDELTLSADAFIQVPGLLNARNRIAAQTISLPNANSVAYVAINRSGATPASLTVLVADNDAISLGNDHVVVARRTSAGVLVGAHSFLLKAGEYLELDGALAEINRYMGQLKIKRHEADLDKARVNAADSLLLNGTTLSQVIDNFLLDFTGAVIDFTTGVITKEDGVTALGTNFTPFAVPVGEYFWYGISLNPGDVNVDNTQAATLQIDPADSSDAVQGDALRPVITGSIKLGAIQVYNNGGDIEVVDLKPLGVGSGSGGGSGQGASFDAEVRTYLKLSQYEFAEENIFPVDQKTKVDLVNSTGAYAPATKTFKMTAGQIMQSIELLDPDFVSATRPLAKARVILRYASVAKTDSDPVVELQKNGGSFEAVTMSRIGGTDTFDGEIEFDAANGTSLILRITATDPSEIYAYAVMYDTTFVAVPLGQGKHIHPVSFSGDDNETTFTLPFLPDPSTLVVYDKTRGQAYIYDPANTFTISGNDIIFVTDFFNFPGETIRLEFRQIVGNGFDNSDQNANTLATVQADIIQLLNGKTKNYAQNAEFRLFQRQVPGTLTPRADDQYGPDRWYVLTSTGNVETARVEDAPTSSPSRYCAQIRQANAVAQRFGIAQILEKDRIVELRGKEVTFGFWVRTDGTEVPTIRASLVEWSGTADTVTSDIVSSWAATPTLIANASFVTTPADFAVGSGWTYFEVTGNLSNTMNNLMMFIWTPNAEAQNDDLYVTQAQIVRGNRSRAWEAVAIAPEENAKECQFFYEKSYDLNTAPGTAAMLSGSILFDNMTTSPSSTARSVEYKVTKRVLPTVTGYNPNSGAAGSARGNSGVDLTLTIPFTNTVSISSTSRFQAAVLNIPAGSSGAFHWTADSEL